MILPIVKYGHPVLRQRGARIEKITPEIEQLIRDMFDTMRHAKGVGLAAQQVGHALQLTVLDVRGIEDLIRQRNIGGLEFLASYTFAKGTTNNRGFYGVFGSGPITQMQARIAHQHRSVFGKLAGIKELLHREAMVAAAGPGVRSMAPGIGSCGPARWRRAWRRSENPGLTRRSEVTRCCRSLRYLVVAFTDRSGRLRLISAREMTRGERQAHK